jgi:predicted Zn-dependent peptidase
MTKNRSQAPEIGALQNISLVQPEIHITENGLPIHVIREVPNDIFHVHIEFGAGKMQQNKPLISSFTADLLFSGTKDMSQLEIQEKLDMQGAFVNVETGMNRSSLHVYGLLNHFQATFEIVRDVLENAIFPEDKFEMHRKAALQHHVINMEKNAYVARREFLKALFPNNKLGEVADESDFSNITAEDCRGYYQEQLAKNIEQINIVGPVSEEHIALLAEIFIHRYSKTKEAENLDLTYTPVQQYIEKTKAMQSTIRIGRVLFTPKHEDYFEFDILETILGGYFGSRLMQNLREDKGYTYGVGSGITAFENTGYFFISTEVGKAHKDAAIEAIKHEIERLRNEEIVAEELDLARAYIQGQILKSTDGAFAQMTQFLFAKGFGLSQNHLNDFLETLNKISPKRLQELAQKYLDWEKMVVVVVG